MIDKTERFEFRTNKELAEKLKKQKNVSEFCRQAVVQKLGETESGK